jgi:hypothetical protein
MELAYDYFAEAALLDLDDLQHNTRDGVHIASLAAACTAAITGFAGLRDLRGTLSFVPRLPQARAPAPPPADRARVAELARLRRREPDRALSAQFAGASVGVSNGLLVDELSVGAREAGRNASRLTAPSPATS